MAETHELIQELVDHLLGTCKSMQEGCYAVMGDDFEEEMLTQEDHAFIDGEIFKCETCDWWHEVADSGDSEGNCNECSEPEDEDE